jgi:hypothetical protein
MPGGPDDIGFEDELPTIDDDDDDDEHVGDPTGEPATPDDATDDQAADDDGESAAPAPPRRRSPEPSREQAELVALRRENELLRQQRQAPAAPPPPRLETDDEFNHRISDLDPAEQMRLSLARANASHQQQMAWLMMQQNEATDKASFASMRHFDAWAKKYGDEVERRHQELLNGTGGLPPQFVPREALLDKIIGERARTREPANRQERRQQQAQQRRAGQQTVRSPNNRGDAGSGGRGQGTSRGALTEPEARRKRLDGVFL